MLRLHRPLHPCGLARATAPVAAALAGALLLSGCGTDEPVAAPSPTVSATTAPPEDPATPQPATTPTPDDAQVIAITVAGGEVTGVQPRTQVPVGTRVRLTVTSDVTDEVHVHGYDEYLDLVPGQAAQLEFVADTPGLFEVELHDSRQVLTRLQVQ
ncbi:MAG TPA: hypothetical protein VNU66_08935 [Mycobacteriales bacterium]|nr:hypothetical protein [Mycobacteriales bacterium]